MVDAGAPPAIGAPAVNQDSAGFVSGALAGYRADAAYLSVGQLGLQPPSYLLEYWTETVRTVGVRRVILIHWDDFFGRCQSRCGPCHMRPTT